MEIKNFEINTDTKRPHLATFSVYLEPLCTIHRLFILKNKKTKNYFWLAPCYRKSDEDKTKYPFVDFGDRFEDFKKQVYELLKPYFKQLDEKGISNEKA